jgi:P-type Mg2+ transporter
MTVTAMSVRPPAVGRPMTLQDASGLPLDDVIHQLGSGPSGLPEDEAVRRLQRYGPNAVSSHQASAPAVLWHQVRSPLLALLLAAAIASYFVGQRSDALIIAIIVALSVGLGFLNEYRAAKAAEALHSRISHQALVVRGGRTGAVPVTSLVPGDLIELRLGDIVPADARLLRATELECDESILTGESMPVTKSVGVAGTGATLGELAGCALMGTVVHAGSARAVVVATGPATTFGHIAAGLGGGATETAFQAGLRRFSMLLVYVAAVLTIGIFGVNVVLHRPILDALLFSLAIAVGITPQLLPAVVSTSLAAGSRQLAKRQVLVKRLVCIEDLGDVDTLFTDKTGTLTEGRISFMRAVPIGDRPAEAVMRLGLLCTEPTGGNQLDLALRDSPAVRAARGITSEVTLTAMLPFDHERRIVSVLVRDAAGAQTLISKGAPESVLDRCRGISPEARSALEAEFAAGNRVVAVATRDGTGMTGLSPADERDLRLVGLLVFLDAPKPDAAEALRRLAGLGITVKVVTGDNPLVAEKVCSELSLPPGGTLTGADIDRLGDDELARRIVTTTVFARVSPEQKARIVGVQRRAGGDVAFLGDGVNDALALHAADVGISVDTAADIAKDAADVILLRKDLDVLADGVVEGRRIFANTIKYVLMGTSSNFGNMFSAAGASLFLGFLPMLPSQILLNNLLYDTSQLAIPTDEADPEQLRRPSHWDMRFIRRFMLTFGPLSSIFDFLTFAVLLQLLHAGPVEFRTGWFVESLATQTLIVFAIRTRRVPFFRSRPSLPLTLAALGVVTVGALLPAMPVAHLLGFAPLPMTYFAALVVLVLSYLVLVEVAKRLFYRHVGTATARRHRPPSAHRHLRRRAARFSAIRPELDRR